MDNENATNPNPEPPVVPQAPAAQTEDKAAKRKKALKRIATLGSMIYGVLLLLVIVWGIFLAPLELTIFDYLPVTQHGLERVLMGIFNLLLGLVVCGSLLYALFGLLHGLMLKKDQLDKKKKASRMALYGGIGFFILTVLWLTGIWFLGPRLITEQRYSSPIITVPESTVGLTAPVSIVFDASEIPIDPSTYEVLSYTWNFGDGDTANGQSVSHRYTQKAVGDGRYTVTLNVSYMDIKSGAQFDAEFATEVTIDNELVAAEFTASPQSGELPLNVTFDASDSYDPDGEIIAYEWDLDGDGRYDDAEGVEVQYEYTQEGSYEVSLRVTDNNGEFNVNSMMIEAGSVNGLRAVITSEHSGEYYVDEKYSFTGESSQVESGSITKYTWDFGDGSTSVQSRSASHSYSEAGSYEIRLTVQDSEGNQDDAILEIDVLDEGSAPVAQISASTTSGPVPLEVDFDASDSSDLEDDIVQYEWDFDNDGTIDDTGDSASHSYEEVGNYEARLIVTDASGNTDEEIQEIEVTEQGLIARLEVSVSNGEVPLTVKFDASSSSYKEGDIVSYEYDFGDGKDSYVGGSSVTYKYTEIGTYEASVTVLASDGETDTTTVQIVVRPVALTACFTVNTDSGSAPLYVNVDPSCSEGTVKSYNWDFGDGDVSFDRKPETHTYDESGTYTITLEVTNDEGIVDIFTNEITVK